MENLGIQPIQLLAQAFNFLLLLFILKKYLYKPILKILEERKKKIEDGLEYSEKMKKELEKSEKTKQDIVSQTKEEAQKLLTEAKKNVKKQQAQILEETEIQAKVLLDKAKKDIDVQRNEMEKDIHEQAVEIALRIVEKVIKESLDDTSHQNIINKKIKEIAKVKK